MTEAKKSNEKKKSCKKPLIIGIVIILVAAIVTLIILGINGVFDNRSGTYEIVSMEKDGEDQSSMINFMKALGMSGTITFNSDKTGTINLFSEESQPITYDNSKIKSNDETGDLEYTYKDGKITIVMDGATMTFEKKENK